MLDESLKGWPEYIDYSMAPFMYSVHADKTEHTDTSVAYRCRHCNFQVSVDPRDMTIQAASMLMRRHMDQAH